MAYLIQLIVLASIFIVPTLSDWMDNPEIMLPKCDEILNRTDGFMPLLEKIVKEAVDGAQKDRRNWQNVGKEIDEFTKYVDFIDVYSELEMPKKCSKIYPLYALYGGYTPEQWLLVAKIEFAKALKEKKVVPKNRPLNECKPADTYVRFLLKCKQMCHNAANVDPKYQLLPTKLEKFFHSVGIGIGEEHEKGGNSPGTSRRSPRHHDVFTH